MQDLKWVSERAICAAIGCSTLFAGGCDRVDESSAQTVSRLRIIAAAYLDYAAARGTGPTNERLLIAHMPNTLAGSLAKEAIQDGSLFVSDRDGAPFLIQYGLPISQSIGNTAPVIAIERQGQSGTRYVAFANGTVDCVNASSIRPLLEAVADK